MALSKDPEKRKRQLRAIWAHIDEVWEDSHTFEDPDELSDKSEGLRDRVLRAFDIDEEYAEDFYEGLG